MPFDGVVVSGETLWSRQNVGSKEFILCHVGSLNIHVIPEYPKQLSFLPLNDDLGSLCSLFTGWKHQKLKIQVCSINIKSSQKHEIL